MHTNYHVLRNQYHGATNHRGSRFSITSDRFKQRVMVDYDQAARSATEQAASWLTSRGFTIIGGGEGPRWDYLISSTFEPIK